VFQIETQVTLLIKQKMLVRYDINARYKICFQEILSKYMIIHQFKVCKEAIWNELQRKEVRTQLAKNKKR